MPCDENRVYLLRLPTAMFRPFKNYPMVLLAEVYEEASQELLDLLGFKVWFGIGHRGDHMRSASRATEGGSQVFVPSEELFPLPENREIHLRVAHTGFVSSGSSPGQVFTCASLLLNSPFYSGRRDGFGTGRMPRKRGKPSGPRHRSEARYIRHPADR